MSFDPSHLPPRARETKRVRVQYSSSRPSRTKTTFASESDINVIVGRFLKTGLLPSRTQQPQFGDVSHIPTGTDALMAVRNAQLKFESLPLSLRKELDHDFTKFELWLRDPANLDRAAKLGLISIPKPPEKAPGQALGNAQDLAGGSGGQGGQAPQVEPVDKQNRNAKQ